jgi:hypothetical protein
MRLPLKVSDGSPRFVSQVAFPERCVSNKDAQLFLKNIDRTRPAERRPLCVDIGIAFRIRCGPDKRRSV